MTCTYTCNAGTSNCNKGTPPDTDGCECATPGCCGTGCQTKHSNGVGQSFYDCNPLSTWSSVTALEACQAYVASIGKPAADCTDGYTCSETGATTWVCYGTADQSDCYGPCWGYEGSPAGEVQSAASACGCPFTKAASWD